MHLTVPELDLLTRPQAAKRLGVSSTTLARWAQQHRGPRFSRSGEVRGRVWYSTADLAAWLESRKTTPRAGRGATSKPTGG